MVATGIQLLRLKSSEIYANLGTSERRTIRGLTLRENEGGTLKVRTLLKLGKARLLMDEFYMGPIIDISWTIKRRTFCIFIFNAQGQT